MTAESLVDVLDGADGMTRELDEKFFRECWPALIRLDRLLTGSQEWAEDLAQETIVGLLRRGPVQAPRAYLRRSLVNLSIHTARRANRERGHQRLVRGEVVPRPRSTTYGR